MATTYVAWLHQSALGNISFMKESLLGAHKNYVFSNHKKLHEKCVMACNVLLTSMSSLFLSLSLSIFSLLSLSFEGEAGMIGEKLPPTPPPH